MTLTSGEWALLIGLLANALAIWIGMARIGKNVLKIELATNSMKDELVAATGKAQFAAGREDARSKAVIETGSKEPP